MSATLVRPQAARFAEALSPQVMGPRLAPIALAHRSDTSSVAPVARQRYSSCRVLDAKYEPGVRAVILYEVAGHLLRGDLVEDHEALVGDASLVEPGVAVAAFPHDPELPTLPQVMAAGDLGPALASIAGGPWSHLDSRLASRCRITLLRYRPGKRATVVVRHGMAPSVVAKAYHNTAKAAAVVDEAPRLQTLTTAQGLLAFAPTLAFVPELAVVVQQPVHGIPLDALLSTPSGSAAREPLAIAARALAELHGGPVITHRPRPVEKELARFRQRADRIATVDPRLGDAAGRLADRLTELLGELPPARIGTVHGDCKPSQFLIGRDRVFLLDLDHCGVGDQAGDVGTFLATLRQQEIRKDLWGRARGARLAASRAELFIGAYLRSSSGDRSVAMARIRWQEAVALERKALRAFARAPRSPLAGALIWEADRCLDTLTEAA
jgi:hypothetical protein